MTISLNWLNRNTLYDSVTLYRTAAPLNIASLPTPLAVLTNGETTYTDSTSVKGTCYYYTLAVTRGALVVYSNSKAIADFVNAGPGAVKPLRGDWWCGYFGTVTPAQLFTTTQVAALAGLTPYTTNDATLLWHKFAFHGKILYFPSGQISSGASWNNLYTAGLVFGVAGVGPTGHSNTPTAQYKTLNNGGIGDTFIVRLPRLNQTANYVAGTIDLASELMACIYLLQGNNTATGPAFDLVTLINNTLSGHIAEFGTGALTGPCSYFGTTNTFVSSDGTTNGQRNTVGAWRPVLELIPR